VALLVTVLASLAAQLLVAAITTAEERGEPDAVMLA
jgi:hypothetical protein